MPTIDFFGASRRDGENPAANPTRMVNCYREPMGPNFAIKSVPGLAVWNADGPAVVRAAFYDTDRDKVMILGDTELIQIAGATGSQGATISGTFADGFSVIRANDLCTISVPDHFYTWNNTAVIERTGGAFADIGAHDTVGNYTVITERVGQSRFKWSALGDPTSFPANNWATAQLPDRVIYRPFNINGNLWIWMTNAYEVWETTGLSGANAFAPINGAFGQVGLWARELIADIPPGAFIVGSDAICRVVSGLSLHPVSIPAVHTAIQHEFPQRCFYYEWEGHQFVVITFLNRAAWVYDLGTGEWHERGDDEAWIMASSVKRGLAWLMVENVGNTYTLTATRTVAGSQPIRREMVSRRFDNDGEGFSLDALEVLAMAGVEDSDGPVDLSLYTSRDGGRTYRGPLVRGYGDDGDYEKVAEWRALGYFPESLTVKLTMDADVDIPVNAKCRIETS